MDASGYYQAESDRHAAPGTRAAAPAAAPAPAPAVSLPPAALAAAATLGAWMSQPAVCDTYVRLLAEYEPSSVLAFLQQHQEYDVRRCIQICRTAGVLDGEAYLHERLGEYDAAMRLHLKDITRCVLGAATSLPARQVCISLHSHLAGTITNHWA